MSAVTYMNLLRLCGKAALCRECTRLTSCAGGPPDVRHAHIQERFCLCNSALLSSARLRSALLCSALLCSAPLRSAPLRSAPLGSALLCSALLCSALLYAIHACSGAHAPKTFGRPRRVRQHDMTVGTVRMALHCHRGALMLHLIMSRPVVKCHIIACPGSQDTRW